MRDFPPRWRKAWRDAGQHRARTVLVILATATGLAAAGIILNAYALVERATHDGYLASDPPAATIRVDSVDEQTLQRIHAVPGVRDVDARRTASVAILAGGSWQNAAVSGGEDLEHSRVGKLRLESGAWPTHDDEILIERSSLGLIDAGLNDRVSLALPNRDAVSMRVSGIVRDVDLAPGWMEHAVYVFMTPPGLERIGLPRSMNALRLVVDQRAATRDDVRAIAARARAALEASGHAVLDVSVPEPGEHIHAAQMNSLLYTQAAFGVLALTVCAFLVVNLVAAMLAGQAREIGVMKMLGAGGRQLMTMYLAFAAMLGVAALLVAMPIAVVAGRAYGEMRGDLLNFEVATYAIPWWSIAIQILIGILVPVLAAWIPVRRACAVPVAESLRDLSVNRSSDQFSDHWSARLGGLARPVLLAIRNAFRARTRMILTLSALALGGAVFLAAARLRASVIESVDLLFSAQKYAFSIRLENGFDVDSVEHIAASVAGVREAESWSGLRAAVVGADNLEHDAFPITAPPAATKLMQPPLEEGRWVREGERAIVASRSLQKTEPLVKIGAGVTLTIAGHRDVWPVVGIVDAGPSPTAFTSRETALQIRGGRRVSAVVIDADAVGTGMQVDLIQRVRAAYTSAGMPVSSSQLVDENRRVLQDHLLMVVQFLTAMGWVMIVVGGMGLTSTMSLAVLERTREIGVMRAIGARHSAMWDPLESTCRHASLSIL